MKNFIAAAFLISMLCSCSILQRHNDESATSSEENNTSGEAPSLEAEVAKLHARIEALETRIDVLTNSMEKNQLKTSQPIISAISTEPPRRSPPSLAQEVIAPEEQEIAAAPQESITVKYTPPPTEQAPQKAEIDFQEAMTLFQQGKNAEASGKFIALAKQYPSHILASHSLYWAGEAAARSQYWSTAIEQWENLEKNYSRSAYLPESLAGLSRAYDAKGEPEKAKTYRVTLLQAFPQAPATLNFTTHSAQGDEQTESYNSTTEVEEE